MGLTSAGSGGTVRRGDVTVAKNYLNQDELETLNRIVSMYLDFAELQARSRKQMTMRDWIVKLDDFLKVSGRELLDHAGEISAEMARLKAELEYDRYRVSESAKPQAVDADFERVVKQLEQGKGLRK